MLYSEFDRDLALAVSFEDGYKHGYDIGFKKGKVDHAKTALSMGFSIKVVSKITGLDEKAVVEIKNEPPK
ncbi:MAG: hypothetical protein LBT38_05320 [Deltaproteobacteria bacterium]|jgi:hypothetical protein|nr:hypothetical protein [Deltaproteobacteria bacterium]